LTQIDDTILFFQSTCIVPANTVRICLLLCSCHEHSFVDFLVLIKTEILSFGLWFWSKNRPLPAISSGEL